MLVPWRVDIILSDYQWSTYSWYLCICGLWGCFSPPGSEISRGHSCLWPWLMTVLVLSFTALGGLWSVIAARQGFLRMVSYYNQPFWVWGPLFCSHYIFADMACYHHTKLRIQSIEATGHISAMGLGNQAQLGLRFDRWRFWVTRKVKQQFILVGDQKQLPPVVLCQAAADKGSFDCIFFSDGCDNTLKPQSLRVKVWLMEAGFWNQRAREKEHTSDI